MPRNPVQRLHNSPKAITPCQANPVQQTNGPMPENLSLLISVPNGGGLVIDSIVPASIGISSDGESSIVYLVIDGGIGQSAGCKAFVGIIDSLRDMQILLDLKNAFQVMGIGSTSQNVSTRFIRAFMTTPVCLTLYIFSISSFSLSKSWAATTPKFNSIKMCSVSCCHIVPTSGFPRTIRVISDVEVVVMTDNTADDISQGVEYVIQKLKQAYVGNHQLIDKLRFTPYTELNVETVELINLHMMERPLKIGLRVLSDQEFESTMSLNDPAEGTVEGQAPIAPNQGVNVGNNNNNNNNSNNNNNNNDNHPQTSNKMRGDGIKEVIYKSGEGSPVGFIKMDGVVLGMQPLSRLYLSKIVEFKEMKREVKTKLIPLIGGRLQEVATMLPSMNGVSGVEEFIVPITTEQPIKAKVLGVSMIDGSE